MFIFHPVGHTDLALDEELQDVFFVFSQLEGDVRVLVEEFRQAHEIVETRRQHLPCELKKKIEIL